MALDHDALAQMAGSNNEVITRLAAPLPPTSTTPRTPRRTPKPDYRKIHISFWVHWDHAPALRSAVEEISNEVGGRLEGLHRHTKEHSLTRAACALGRLRDAVNTAIPAGDPEYV